MTSCSLVNAVAVLIGAVVGEFVTASVGMGVMIRRFSCQLLLAEAFAVFIMQTMMGLILRRIHP